MRQGWSAFRRAGSEPDLPGTLDLGSWTRLVARASQSLAGRLAGQLAAVHDQDSVDGHVPEALAVAVGALERRGGADRRRIEDGEGGRETGLDEPPAGQSCRLRREGRHLPDRLLQAQDLLLAHVVAEDSGGPAPAARTRGLVRA